MIDRRTALLLCLTATITGACTSGDRAASADVPRAGVAGPARSAELFFTTGLAGYIEPCGCTSKPLGGIQRLATVIGGSAVAHGLVDAGELLFPPEGLGDAVRDQHLLKARILARAYRKLGGLALNLGDSDLAAGQGLLKDLQREGAVPYVSANIRPVGEAGPSVAQSFIRELGGIPIGITGVATPERFRGIADVTALEYAPALRSEVALLKKRGAEIIVVLAAVGDDGARDLARAVPDVDLILRAPGTPIGHDPAAPVRVGNVVIAEAGSQGQFVGRLHLGLPAGEVAHPLPFDDGGYAARQQAELLGRRIEALAREIKTLSADPAQAEGVAARKAQLAQLEARRTAAQAGQDANKSGLGLRLDIVPLTTQIESDAAMTDLLNAYYAQLKQLNAAKGDVALCAVKDKKTTATFVGSEKCAECHDGEYAFWKKTKHASAWATLENAGKHYDLTCIGCHTIGYQQPGGFCRLADVGILKNVGCEDCHGAGSRHVADQDTASITLAAPATTCNRGCHIPQHSDRFDYATYVREITGVGHEMKPALARGTKG